MVDLRRVPVAWTTGVGGEGVSVFYTADPDDVTTELGTFFNAIKDLFPPVVTWTVPSAGDIIDDASGALTGAWSGGTAATVTGTNNTNYVAGTGAYIRWLTGGIRGSRKFQGRTFLCPLVTSQFDSVGTINDTGRTTIQTAANTLEAAGKLQLWGRPIPPSTNNGTSGQIIAAIVPDKVTSLRTRRT